MKKIKVPLPECELGYPDNQIKEIMGTRLKEFNSWMRGQTAAICDGRKYNYHTEDFDSIGCGPHGPVIYPWDVQRFLDNLPIID